MSLRLCIVADIHHGAPSHTKRGDTALALMEEFARFAADARPDMVLDLGDRITDADRETDMRLQREVAEAFAPIVAPRHHLNGNHDRDHLSVEDNAGILGQPLHHQVIDAGQWQIVLWRADSQIHRAGPVPGFDLPPQDLEWLESTMRAARKPTLVVSHVPVSGHAQTGNFYFERNPEFATYPQTARARAALAQARVPVVCLAGHVHWNTVTTVDGIPHLTQQSLTESFTTEGEPAAAMGLLELGDAVRWEVSGRDLGVAFGEVEAVRGLSFDITAGETLALVGESGSGKSASALAILRLIEREGGRITGGTIAFDEGSGPVDLTALDERAMTGLRGRAISMVFQEPMTSLNPVLTIGDQVSEVFRRHRRLGAAAARAAAEEALSRVAIPEPARRLRQYPHELSGGLRQRVMIAMALACRPRLLIADEPSTALDVTTQAGILSLIRDLQAEIGMAVLFITHDMGVVARIADRVVVMRNGRQIEEATKDRLFAAPRSDYARMLLDASPRLGAGSPPWRGQDSEVLRVRGLSTSFPGDRPLIGRGTPPVPVVRDVSLSIRAGETLGLVGESGCGKSTLARSILRLIEPDRGEITLDGQRLDLADRGALRRARRNAQLVFQDPYASLNPRLPVYDQITEPAWIHGLVPARERRDMAAGLVRRVGLSEDAIDRYP
ncbi:MAG: ATP-binding cassette domain-containing protein, partial [Paracoccaceae bacterium]